ncbi:MAG TPA: hypothetical protein QGH03_00845 [Candidatus Paceibacterota bacterium]|jgi:hypothetical protein|nr:hypothetical protein [Parcubacteria group bacterium]MDP6119667.1 hypothetical protein [Candidatus Paceibacterota bacterium]HJN62765.1 hypothetical protein [Candidatus Paceibacterota bacterium]|tara:strand:+ start:152 stop:331 length:180 start_codon:yes stop_codon:yes gene_type:complete
MKYAEKIRIEDGLPLSLHKVEWEALKGRHGGLKYYFFKINLLIPCVFTLLYLFIIVFSL